MLNHSATLIVPLVGLVSHLLVLWWFVPLWRVGWSGPQLDKLKPQRRPGPTEPKPCPACATAQTKRETVTSPGEPPPALVCKRGRPRSVDTSSHYCPNQSCRYYGWLGLGNIRANGHPNGGRWHQLACTGCHRTFLETINTIFYGKQVPAETIWQALKALAEGLDLRATARVFDLDPNTVESWLTQAAQHLTAVSHDLIHDLHLSQVQVDELWTLLGQAELTHQRQGRSQCWVWVGIDPVSKLRLAWVVGDRSLACAQRLVHAIWLLLAPDCVPLFLSDQWSAYEAT